MTTGRTVMIEHRLPRAATSRRDRAKASVPTRSTRATRPVLRLNGGQKGSALLLAEILDHHLIVRGQRPSAAQQLINRQLEMLFAIVWRPRRHSPNVGRAGRSAIGGSESSSIASAVLLVTNRGPARPPIPRCGWRPVCWRWPLPRRSCACLRARPSRARSGSTSSAHHDRAGARRR